MSRVREGHIYKERSRAKLRAQHIAHHAQLVLQQCAVTGSILRKKTRYIYV